MVGTKAWNEEQRTFVVDMNSRGHSYEVIAGLFKERYPVAVLNKRFTKNSVKYIVDDCNKIRARDQESGSLNKQPDPVPGVGRSNSSDQGTMSSSRILKAPSNMSGIDAVSSLVNARPSRNAFQSPVGSSILTPAHQGFGTLGQIEQRQHGISHLNAGFQLSTTLGSGDTSGASYMPPHMPPVLRNPSRTPPVNSLSYSHGVSAHGNTQSQSAYPAVNYSSTARYIQGNTMSSGTPVSQGSQAKPVREMVRFFDHVIDRDTLDSLRQNLMKQGWTVGEIEGRMKLLLDLQRQRYSAISNHLHNSPNRIQANGPSDTPLQSLTAGNMGIPGVQKQLAHQSNLQQKQTNPPPHLPATRHHGLHPTTIQEATDSFQQFLRSMEKTGMTRQQYSLLIQSQLAEHNRQKSLNERATDLKQTVSHTQNAQQYLGNMATASNPMAGTQEAPDQILAKINQTLAANNHSRPAKKEKRAEAAKIEGRPSPSFKNTKKRTEATNHGTPSQILTNSNEESGVLSGPPMLTQQRYVDPFPTRHDPPAVNDLFSEEFRFTGNRLGCIVSGDFTADYQTREQERDLMFSSNQGPNANFNREAHHRLAGLENQNAASQGTYGLGSATVLPLQPTQSGRTPSPMHQPNASQDGLQILNQRHLGPAQASRNDPQVHYFTQQSSPQAGNAGSQWKGVPGLTASQLQATQEAIRRQVCDQDAALRASQQQRQHGLGQNEPRASGQGASPRRQPGQANGFVQGDAQQALQADPSDIGADLFPKLGSIDSTDEGLYNDGGSQANMHPTPHPPLSQGTKRKAPEDFLCDFDQLPSKHSKTENDLQGDSFSWACEEYPEIGQVGEFDWLDYVTFDEEFGPSGKLAMGDGLGESNANATEIEGATKSGNKIPSTDTFTPLATPHAHGSASSPGWEPPLANSNGPSASALPNLAVDELPETDPAQESTPPRVVPLEYQNTKFERALEGNDWIPADYNISWHREALREFEEEQPRQTSAQRESKVLGDPIRQAIQRRVMHGVSASNDRYISVSESRGGFTQPAFNQTHGGSFGSATWTQAWMKNCPSNDKVEAHDAESRAFHLKAQADDTDPIGHALTKPTNFPIEYDEEDQQMLEDLIRRSQV